MELTPAQEELWKFLVDHTLDNEAASSATPESPVSQLGVDSLILTEVIFHVEDKNDVYISNEIIDSLDINLDMSFLELSDKLEDMVDQTRELK